MGQLRRIERLSGVDEELKTCLMEAVHSLPFNCTVSEGVRSKEQAIINYRQGRTKKELLAVGITDAPLPGPKITWTLHSKHIEGLAADIYPLLDNGQLDDGKSPLKLARFDALYHAVMLEGAKRKVRIRYGGDWDQDGKLREQGETDSPHFERVK